MGPRETNVGFAGRAGREERRDAQQHIGTRARRLRMRVVQDGRASMKIAAQIMRGMGWMNSMASLSSLLSSFWGSSFLPNFSSREVASASVSPSSWVLKSTAFSTPR